MTPGAFYRNVLRQLTRAGVPFQVGGAYALMHHTGMRRWTRDLDLMVRRDDWPMAAHTLRAHGIRTRLPFPHWLGKAASNGYEVDIIFSGGNGLTKVDDVWMSRGKPGRVLGCLVHLAPPEELLWTKAFVMERERYDGADVQHLLLALAEGLDWAHLCWRFRGHERVLLAHVMLFTYVYPGHAHRLPAGLIDRLLTAPPISTNGAGADRLCRGTLLSRAQYLPDIEAQGFEDARRPPYGPMTERELRIWTRAINHSK
jgi:hypothetical protein